ncbi:MAG TPA: DUF2064 domain-containing protein [Thermomicrobiales bacterium]|jgi:hypothetical protein
MIGTGRSGTPTRTSPRQAILVDAGDFHVPCSPRADRAPVALSVEVRRAVLLDLLGSLVGVNGATISVVASGVAQARTIAATIPPGIDLITPPVDAAERGGRFVWAIEHLLRRAFTAVVAVPSDLPALPTRTVATALSSLATADVVVGPTTGSGLYLLGIRDDVGLGVAVAAGAATGFDGLTLTALTAAAGSRDAIVRGLERRSRLPDDATPDQVREAIATTPTAAPRTAALLRGLTDAAEIGPAFPATFGGHDFARG